jgi:hypothetical protein
MSVKYHPNYPAAVADGHHTGEVTIIRNEEKWAHSQLGDRLEKVLFGSNERLYRRTEVFFCSNDRCSLSSPMFTEWSSFEIKSKIHQIIY